MKITHLLFFITIFIVAYACELGEPTQNQSTTETALPVKEVESQPVAEDVLTLKDITHFLAPDQNDTDLKITLGKKFALRQDQKAILETREEFSILVQKIADSRCPPNVNCIRAGEITVVLGISEKGAERAAILTYPTKEKPQSKDNMDIGDYNIEFLGAVQQNKDKTKNNSDKFTVGKEKDLLLGFTLQRAKAVVK